jgi:2-aminoethylphosphonate dioxygenase
MATAIQQACSSVAQEYSTNGYAIVRGMFSGAEVAAIQQECDRLFSLFSAERDRHNLRVQFRNHESGQPALDRIDPCADISPLLRDLGRDARIMAKVEEVLGQPGLLFKDKIILKGPGTHGYGLHQDYTYWQELPAPAESLLSVLFAVDSSSPENGGLQFFEGMHREHYRERETPSDIFNPKAGLVPGGTMAGRSAVSPVLAAGDIAIFHSLIPHQSGVNRSNSTRRSIYFSYNAAVYGDIYDTYLRNFYRYLRKDRAAEGDKLHVR